MDPIKGAEILSHRLSSVERERASRPLVPENALPLFHWLGVEPVATAAGVSGPDIEGAIASRDRPLARRLRFRARSV